MSEQSTSPLPTKRATLTYLSFPEAIKAIIENKRVTRAEWGTNEEYCLLRNGWLTIYRKGEFHSWILNDGDLLATDWMVLSDKN